jgi:hypothetical protein
MIARRLELGGARAFCSLPTACCRRLLVRLSFRASEQSRQSSFAGCLEAVRQHAGYSGQHARAPLPLRLQRLR